MDDNVKGKPPGAKNPKVPSAKMYTPTPMGRMGKRQRFEIIRQQMYNERSSFISHWRELSEYIQPRRSRFFVEDDDRGERRNGNIIDTTATLSIRTMRAGMMGGITSPARPWFKLDTPTTSLINKSPAVKQWLESTTDKMLSVFLKSNLYNSMPQLYGDLGGFGTAAMLVEEDLDEVFRTYVFPIGSYMIALNAKNQVGTFYREFRMTVQQLIDKFGNKKPGGEIDWENFNWNNFSPIIRNMVQTNQFHAKFIVCHMIVENDQFNSEAFDWRGKRFSSHYYEKGVTTLDQWYANSPMDDLFLRESGYDYFPVLCPRWEVTGEDIYATDCPAMTALGDIKMLQMMHKRKMQAIEKMINPPMVGPGTLKNAKTSILPGDITYLEGREGTQQFKPVYQIQFDVSDLREDIKETQGRIQRAFYEDLFLMMANQDNAEPITATEVNERHEEKLLALGPVLEQMNQDVLDPLIDIVFSLMVKQGLIDKAPPEMHGMPLRVEYTSIMAEAQKLLGIASIEKFAQFVQPIIESIPSAADVVNFDELILEYGDKTSINSKALRTEGEIAQIRSQRQKQQQAQAQAQQKLQQSQTAKNFAQAPTDNKNALTDLMNQSQAGNSNPQQ